MHICCVLLVIPKKLNSTYVYNVKCGFMIIVLCYVTTATGFNVDKSPQLRSVHRAIHYCYCCYFISDV